MPKISAMKITIVAIVFFSMNFFSLTSFAAESTSGPAKVQPFDFQLDEKPFIAAKYIVEITEYDAQAKMYHLKRPQFPNATGLYATAESLCTAVQTLELSVLKKRPASIVGNEYLTDHDLIVLSVKEIDQRRKAGK